MTNNVLLTGGLGYIGSHVAILLLSLNYQIIIVDNLSNSNLDVLDKITHITNKIPHFYNIDLLDQNSLDEVFKKHSIDYVIHLASLKAVKESIEKPLLYYENNLIGVINLLKVMSKYNVSKLIFSSSACVYGDQKSPLDEEANTGISLTNPYGKTKYMIEEILKDYSKVNNIKIIILRYFNPIGTHPSTLIGDNPNGIPNNIMPFLLRVAIQNNCKINLGEEYKKLKVFGGNYSTEDGTCERDYIDINDLAEVHVLSLDYFEKNIQYFNVGTSKPTSVLTLIKTFEKVNKVKIPIEVVSRREGDIDRVYCLTDKLEKKLNWKPIYTLEDSCKNCFNFIKKKYI